MPQRIRILLLALVVTIVLVNLSLIVFTASRPTVRPPLPNPNGYEDFLTAAGWLTGDVGHASTLDHDRLRVLVSTNAQALRLIRLGLSRGCSVPTDTAITNINGVLANLTDLKSLARLLAVEGRLAEMEGRNADAAQSYVDAIHFGNETSRGGFVIIRLVGIACEAIGTTPLSKLVPKLTPQEAQLVIAELEKIDRVGVTWDEVLRNENRFAQYQRRNGFNPLIWVASRWEVWRSRQRGQMRHNRIVAHIRLLTAELGVGCFLAENGRAPTGLEQLVPKYLRRVPLDPFSGRPLIYRPQGINWVLYSIGPDGVDDGGKPVGRSAPGTVAKGDLFYDSPY